MKKILILLIVLVMITGCSVNYQLDINKDLTVTEKANLTGTDDFFKTYYRTTKKNTLLSMLDEYKTDLEKNGYKYELKEAEVPYIYVEKTYDNLDVYSESSILFNNYFDEVKYTKDGDKVKIETIGFNENNPLDPSRFNVKELTIAITCPYKVINHNAKDVDKKTNTYYYQLDEDSNYKILLEFNSSKEFNPLESMWVTIIVSLTIIAACWVFVYYMNKRK